MPALRAASRITPAGSTATFSQLGLDPLGHTPPGLKNVGSAHDASSMNTSPLALPPPRLLPPLRMPSPCPYSVIRACPAPSPPSMKRTTTELPATGRLQKLVPSAAVKTSLAWKASASALRTTSSRSPAPRLAPVKCNMRNFVPLRVGRRRERPLPHAGRGGWQPRIRPQRERRRLRNERPDAMAHTAPIRTRQPTS